MILNPKRFPSALTLRRTPVCLPFLRKRGRWDCCLDSFPPSALYPRRTFRVIPSALGAVTGRRVTVMMPQINPSEALALYQSGKSLRAIAALFPGTHPMEVQRVLKRTGCYEPRIRVAAVKPPRPPKLPKGLAAAQRKLAHYEAKAVEWKQIVEELQKAAE
jgi:hypothetical protein